MHTAAQLLCKDVVAMATMMFEMLVMLAMLVGSMVMMGGRGGDGNHNA